MMKRGLVIVSLIWVQCGYAVSWQVYRANNRGTQKLAEKSFHGAYQDFVTALSEDPMNPVVQLNLGLAFELNEEFDKAEQTYQSAAELGKGDSEFSFVTQFNIGSVRGQKKDVDGALKAYQEALSYKVDSLEAKTNIELLVASGGGGQGEGKGEKGEQKADKKEGQGEGEDDKKDKGQGNDKQQKENPKPQPKPFDSKELTPQDVKKILDEIRNQEQMVRAKDYKKGQKDNPRGGKDW